MGYQGKALVDGDYAMTGFSFDTVSGEDINLNDVAFVGEVGGGGPDEADLIQVWDGVGYTEFYKYDDGETIGWFGTWGEDPVITAGYAFWYRGYKADPGALAVQKSMTVSGQVKSTSDVKLPIQDGDYMMFVNPYPVATDLSDEDGSVFVQNVTGGGGPDEADLIQVWDGVGYVEFYRYDDGETIGWFGTWGEDPIINSGDGFWYRGYIPDGEEAKEKKMIFKRPF